MTTAAARGWGNPDAPHYQRDHITTIRAGAIVVLVRREVAAIFAAFIAEIASRGYALDRRKDDWGYDNRDVRGHPGVKSNHAWGLAIDLNAVTNPMTSDGRNHTDMPRWVIDVARKYGLFWGGDYSGARHDPMHFEFLGTPADADHVFRTVVMTQPKEVKVTKEQADKIIELLGEIATGVKETVRVVHALGLDAGRVKTRLGIGDQQSASTIKPMVGATP